MGTGDAVTETWGHMGRTGDTVMDMGGDTEGM